jgi:hypothetical protein
MQLHNYIASIPNLSVAQRQWLHMNPHGLYRFDLLHAAHTEALQRGVPPDSREYFKYLADKLNTYGHLPPQQPTPAAPSPPPMPPPVAHVDLEKVEGPEGVEEEHIAVHHVSAPVSRGSERSYSVDPEPSASSIRLTKAEREHAEAAGVSEVEYAKQLLKMNALKKAKVIRDE